MLIPVKIRENMVSFFNECHAYIGGGCYLGENFHLCLDGIKHEAYPVFDKSEIEFFEKVVAQNPTDKYFQQRFNSLKNIPENIESFYNLDKWAAYLDREKTNGYSNITPSLNSYGVCDSPNQLLEMYDFDADPRKFCISFCETRKADQPHRDGWRWHKWGPYIGDHTPRSEYLHDEPVIESVFVYHIYEILEDQS